jgi:hypothetical protein
VGACLALAGSAAAGGGPGRSEARGAPPALPSLGDARLTLPWSALEELLEAYLKAGMAPEPAEPPVAYTLSGARYAGVLEGETLRLQASFGLRLLAPGWVQVPLFPAGAALLAVRVDGRPAALTADDPRALLVEGPGEFRVEAELLARAPMEAGQNEVRVGIPETGDGQLELDLLARLSEVEVEQAVLIRAGGAPGRARYKGGLRSSGELVLSYTVPAERVEEQAAPRAQAAPKVYATLGHLVSIEEASVRSTALVAFEVREAPVTAFSLRLPVGYALAEVSGQGILGTPEPDAQGLLRVALGFEVKDRYQLRVVVDRTQEEASFVLPLPIVEAVGVEHQSGRVGVQVGAGAEVRPKSMQGVFGLDPSELPLELQREARNPIALALGYRKPGFRAELAVTRHLPMPVLDAAVDSAEVAVQLAADGKSVTRVIYRLRNQHRQFLRVGLPPGGQVWTAHVNGRPVKPALSEAGEAQAGPEVLLPLERSGRAGGELQAYAVELLYFAPVDALTGLGRMGLELPRCDLPISRMELELFVPPERMPLGFGGELTPRFELASALIPGGLFPWSSDEKHFAALAFAPSAAAPVEDREEDRGVEQVGERGQARGRADIARQMVVSQDEVQTQAPALSLTSLGALPARFELPRAGRVFRFERLLVMPGASSALSLWHGPRWLGLALGLLAGLLAALAAWFLGRHLWAATRGERAWLCDRRALLPLAGLLGLVALALALPLQGYPLWWGLWSAVALWALRQVFLRGWPFRPLARWWRSRRSSAG